MPPLAKPKVNKHHGNYNKSKRSGGTSAIKYICVHYTATDASAKNNCIYFSGGNRGASADFFIDNNGIWEYNDPASGYYTWAVGDGHGKYGITNSNSVSIEVVSSGKKDFSKTEIGYLTTLVKYLMSKYNVKADHVVRHYDASRKTCPVQYCPPRDGGNKKWNELWKQITSGTGLAPTTSSDTSPDGSGGSGDGEGGGGEIIDSATAYAYAINHDVIFGREDTYPYMITIDQNTSTIDYTNLKKSDIVAVCIDIGQYYTPSHTVRKNFCQPKFDKQCEEVESKKFPFALYTNVYAKTTEEVEKEVEQIRFAVRRHPPKLGLWIVPHFGTNKKLNDTLIRKYRELLEKLGFKGQIGFYCKIEDLKYTSWKTEHCDYWYFWMNKHMTKLDTLKEGVPTPDFFRFEKPTDELMLPDFEKAENVSLGGSGDGSGSGGGGPLTGGNNAEKIWNWCINEGFTPQAAAAMLGNTIVESGSENPNPAAQQKGGPGMGIFQWTNGSGRFNNLKKLAAKMGSSWDNLEVQLAFFKQEATSCFKSYTGHGVFRYDTGALAWWPTKVSYDQWKKWTDIPKATECLSRVYMRPSIPHMEKRISFAQKAYNKYAK